MDAHARLLDGFLARLAASPDGDAFALRGGMLVRRWDPARRATDIDLVCRAPLDARALRRIAGGVLARRVADGVVFDAEQFRVDRLDPEHGPRGFRLFAAGTAGGERGEISVDATLHATPPTVTRGPRGWECAPAFVIATKLRVTGELGPRAWRPKDLADLALGLRRFPASRALGEALERAGARPAILDAAWWSDPRAAMRWARHSIAPLAAVLGDVRAALAPFGSRA